MRDRTKALLLALPLFLIVLAMIPGSIILGIYIVNYERYYCDNHLLAYLASGAIMLHSLSFLKLSFEGFGLLKKAWKFI